jgi:type III secretion protein S
MDSGAVIDGCYRALMLVLWLSLPAVLTSAFVGLGMAIVQAVTQIQDQGVAQAIKLIAVFMVMALTSKWVATELYHTADQLFTSVGMGGADVR